MNSAAPQARAAGRLSASAERDEAVGRLRRLFGRSPIDATGAQAISSGLAPLDQVLGGGLACGALHEVASTNETQITAAAGFALALAAMAPRSIVWVVETLSQHESGSPYGPGLVELGIAPERLVTVTSSHPRETVWAMEEALRCRAVGAVIGETRARLIDLVITRRLSLAAQHYGGLALLLRTRPALEPSTAATRWTVNAACTAGGRGSVHFGSGTRFELHLTRNRRGLTGSWIVEWNRDGRCFELTHPERMVEPSLDRSGETCA